MLTIIKNTKKLPTIDYPIDDVVIHLLVHYNLIDEIKKLNLPYLSYDIISNKIYKIALYKEGILNTISDDVIFSHIQLRFLPPAPQAPVGGYWSARYPKYG